ncbi:MAG: protein translocase subunit SecD, partial [Candidatus Wildermuthbacteria bacterium]|nr:protein translocase subunit SecD [Candidatus Wildermuthbacteria bacterium]
MIRNRFIFFAIIILAGLLAFVIVSPVQLQAGVDWWNSFKQNSAVFKYFPFLPHAPNVPFQLGLDVQGGIQLLYEADLSSIQSGEYGSAMQGLRDVIERRV